MSAADLPLVPCSECGDTDPAHHAYGLVKCCPDCRHVLADHDRQVAAQALVEARASVVSAYERMVQSEEAAAWVAWIAGLLAARADSLAPRPDAPGETKVAVAGRRGGKTDALVKATADECERRGLPVEIITAPEAGEREATPDEAHDIGYAKGHTDGYREGRAERDAQVAEVERLARWKSEAMEALSGWDAVWEALDKPGSLGSRKSVAALAEVERLRAQVAAVEALAWTDADAMDLWWTTCEDAWAVPEWLPGKFLRAALGVTVTDGGA